MSHVTRRIAKRQSELTAAREERRYLVQGGTAAQHRRRALARVQRHAVTRALRLGDYETLEVL